MTTGTVRVSLYKALLFIKIAEALKGGVLNLRHSYKYRSLDDYLIPQAAWQAHRDAYLQRADLTASGGWASDPRHAGRTAGSAISSDQPAYPRGDESPRAFSQRWNVPRAARLPIEPEDSAPLLGLLPKRRFISLVEVLATVQSLHALSRRVCPVAGAVCPDKARGPGVLCGDYRLWLLHRDAQDRQHFLGHLRIRAGKHGQRLLHAGQHPWRERPDRPVYGQLSAPAGLPPRRWPAPHLQRWPEV